MPTFIDATVKDIDERLKEAGNEIARLRAARSALVGNDTAPRSAPANGHRRRRARRGTRAQQVLELLRKRPGQTIPELAQAMGILPNYLYRALPPLEREGLVTRDESKRWSLVAG